MQAVVDEQGRIEIPRELRDRMHLSAGAVVNLEARDVEIVITSEQPQAESANEEGQLVWENGLLVFSRPNAGVMTVDDVNRVIDSIRQERYDRFMNPEVEGS
jgi:AbrB family looped-hinge helix DNA binding protein